MVVGQIPGCIEGATWIHLKSYLRTRVNVPAFFVLLQVLFESEGALSEICPGIGNGQWKTLESLYQAGCMRI